MVGGSYSNGRGSGALLVGYTKDGNVSFSTPITEIVSLSEAGAQTIAFENDD